MLLVVPWLSWASDTLTLAKWLRQYHFGRLTCLETPVSHSSSGIKIELRRYSCFCVRLHPETAALSRAQPLGTPLVVLPELLLCPQLLLCQLLLSAPDSIKEDVFRFLLAVAEAEARLCLCKASENQQLSRSTP